MPGLTHESENKLKIKHTYASFKHLLKHNSVLRHSFRILFVFIGIVALAPFMANDKPLAIKYKGEWLFPAFSFKHQFPISENETLNYHMGKEWKNLPADFAVFAPCSWSPNTIDADNAPRKGPFDAQFMSTKNGEPVSLPLKFRHWLGTTQNGNDVLSCLVHGTKISLSVGIFSMLIAAFLGISLGAAAG